MNALTHESSAMIVDRIRQMGTTPLATAAIIAISTGMRRAEICALRWLDIDFDRLVIHVVHGLTKEGTFSMDTPKDPAGGDATRDIEIGVGLARQLSERKAAMLAEVESIGAEWDEALFVIGKVDGSFKNPDILGREWAMLVKIEGWKGTQGLPVRFHDLRNADLSEIPTFA